MFIISETGCCTFSPFNIILLKTVKIFKNKQTHKPSYICINCDSATKRVSLKLSVDKTRKAN